MFHWVGCLTETMGRFRVGNGFRNFDHHFRMAIRRFRTAGIATWLKKLHLPIFGFCILARLHLYLFVDGIVDVCRRSPGFHWKNVFQMLGNSSGCHSASYHRDSTMLPMSGELYLSVYYRLNRDGDMCTGYTHGVLRSARRAEHDIMT